MIINDSDTYRTWVHYTRKIKTPFPGVRCMDRITGETIEYSNNKWNVLVSMKDGDEVAVMSTGRIYKLIDGKWRKQ